ncbi:MAG: RecX family transcriptional regulator, partial [Candidatus Levybacteria bacterium]|nr:RecX family transcriptional regulator [Candidatus Levybacteria bacterium]
MKKQKNPADEELFARYFNSSLRFLSFRPRSEKEITDYLLKKKLSPEIIEKIKIKLSEYNLIDDKDFAQWWIEQRLRNKQRALRVIKMELRNKGITREVIENALSTFSISPDTESINKLIEKKLKRLDNPTEEDIKKLYQSLVRKGFNFDDVSKKIKEIRKKL